MSRTEGHEQKVQEGDCEKLQDQAKVQNGEDPDPLHKYLNKEFDNFKKKRNARASTRLD